MSATECQRTRIYNNLYILSS